MIARKAWTVGLGFLASVITGWALAAHGAALEGSSGGGDSCELWGAFFIVLPFLALIGAGFLWLIGEISKDIRKERAWKATLTPEQRTAVQVAETAALFAAWGVVHESVVKGREREAARVDQRQADRARQAVQQRYIRPRQQ